MRYRIQETKVGLKLIRILCLFFILFVSSTAPFWHIFFELGKQDGIFGFMTMRSFLYAFGVHFILFGFSIFMFWILQLIPDLSKKIETIKKIGNIGAFMYCSVSLYYLLFIFVDKKKPYPDCYYEVASICFSLLSSFVIYKMFNFSDKMREYNRKKQIENEKFIRTSLEFINELNENIIK